MEKRRVRLYKAQEGGQPSADMLGYPGAQQEQAPQMSEDQLVQSITQDISNDLPKEAIVAKLVNIMGIDMMQASQYVESVYTMLQNQMEEPDEDEEKTPDKVEQQAIEEQEVQPMNKMVMHNDLVEDDEDEDLTDLEDEDMVKYGGMPKASEGLEAGWENRYEVQFPGLEAYLPYNMEEQYSNPAAEIAWQAPEEAADAEEQNSDYTEPVVDPSQFSMGGFKTKRGYVNSVMKLVKKQLGGDQETESNNADPIGDDLRKSHLNAFIGSVKKEGNMSLAKKQAEEQYDQMMAMHQQQMAQPDLSAFIPQNEMGMDQAQYGGMPRQQKRAIRQMQKTLKHLPVGNVGPVSKFDVHRSGIFGSPREYSIEFDNPLVQLANNPMLNANYGYGFNTKVTRTPARVKTEYVRNVVNSETLKEVAKETGSEAAAKATVNTDTPSANATPVATTAPNGTFDVRAGMLADLYPNGAPAAGTVAPGTVTETPIVTPPVITSPSFTPIEEEEAPVVTESSAAGNVYMPPAQFDYSPGLSNVQKDIANPSATKDLFNQGLAGKNTEYQFKNGKWEYGIGNGKWAPVTYQPTLDRLNAGKNRSTAYGTLESKPGYEYRIKNDGSYVKYKKDSTKPIATITPKDKEYAYLKKNIKVADNRRLLLKNYSDLKEVGGSVDNPFVNEYGDLQKFMGGGDDPSIPELTQNDIDDVYSKDTTDPYMPQAQYGGMGKALTQMYLPANMPKRQYQSQMVKGPYDRASGSALASIPGYNPNAVVKEINVTKEGLFGKPRRYTVTYNNNPSGKIEDRKLAYKPIGMPQALAEGETTKDAFDNASMDRYARQDNKKNERWERQRKRKGYEDDSDFVPMSDEEYMAKVKANNGVAPAAPTGQTIPTFIDDANSMAYDSEMGDAAVINPPVVNPAAVQIQTPTNTPEFNIDDFDLQGQDEMSDSAAVNPTAAPQVISQTNPEVTAQEQIIPQNIKPIAAAPNNAGKQTEEFCYGNSCFEMPEGQADEYNLFNETPRLLKVYASKNNLDWYNPETDELDLSKVDEATLQEALQEGSSSPSLRNQDLGNLESYGNQWLNYQQGNQKAYGNLSSNALSKDASAIAEGLDSSEKYADFLNATGKTAEGKPYSVWDTKGPSRFSAEETNSFVPEVANTVGAIENYRPSRETDAYNYPQEQSGSQEQLSPQDYLFQEQTNSPEFLNSLKGKDAVDAISSVFNRLGDMGEDMLAEEPQPIPFNAMPQYIDRPELELQLPERSVPQPVNKSIEAAPTKQSNTLNDIRNQSKYKEFSYAPTLNFREDPGYKQMVKQFGPEKAYTTYDRKVNVEDKTAKVFSQASALEKKIRNSSTSKAEQKAVIAKIWKQAYDIQSNLESAYQKRVNSGYATRQYGGALDKFMPQALLGKETPVTMENNPTAPEVDIDEDFRLPMISAKDAFKPVYEQSKKDVASRVNFEPEEYSVDYKSKSRVNDTEGALNTFNAAARGATGIIDRLTGRKKEAKMYDNLNADNLYASDPSRDRGDYDTNSGLYRPDEEGQSWNSRSAQYGGSMYEEGGYVEGQDVYMTEDELEEFLANGGEVEYI
jgi:hypothetical protein